MFDIELMQMNAQLSLQSAISKIDTNKSGFVFLVDENKALVGLLTDGDIRRYLIKSTDLSVRSELVMNKKFLSVSEGVSREQVLKILDQKIRFVPVVNDKSQLIRIVTKDFFPLTLQQNFIARSKSPVRISFGGGGTDMTKYFMQFGGVVLNSTIKMYSRCTLKKRDDLKVKIYSHDLKQNLNVDSLEQAHNKDFSLILNLIKLIKPHFGFELEIGSDFPIGSGLGGSAVVMSAIAGCFNQFRMDTWDQYEIAEICFQAERLSMGVDGGWQDQYATVFGGHNFMEFKNENNIIHPLKLQKDITKELEETLVLCYTNKNHQSGDIQTGLQKDLQSNKNIQDLVDQNKQLTYLMKDYLLRGKITELGKTVHESWKLKKQFSKSITDDYLDSIYNLAFENGAYGGKLLGAGGGGYFLFFVAPFKKFHFMKTMNDKGYICSQINFDDEGLQSWKVRCNDEITK
jgi:D-glycero-alpha-D-manno-heptose-7-phosphate kinase